MQRGCLKKQTLALHELGSDPPIQPPKVSKQALNGSDKHCRGLRGRARTKSPLAVPKQQRAALLIPTATLRQQGPRFHPRPRGTKERGRETARTWAWNAVPKLCWWHFFVFIIIFVCKTRWSKYQAIMVFWSDLLEHVLESVDLGQSYYCGFHAKAWENPGSLPLFSLAGLYGFSAWQESPILKVLANIVQFVTPRLMI